MSGLFTTGDFAWSLRFRRDDPAAFFRRIDGSGGVLEARNHWLDSAPELCLACSDEGRKLIGETWDLALQWGQVAPDADRNLETLGRRWEADFILFDATTFTLAGGCVCFPSSWDLQESAGKPLAEVHGRVPGLNEQIGGKIERFLRQIPPGQAFLRENWGLTRSDELNYHPALNRPKLDAAVSPEEVFLRIEHQAFVKLPSGVLLGVRIEPVGLPRLAAEFPETARALRRQLETMPREVAVYKGLEAGRERVVQLLRAI